ncbi:MAG: type VI secretion system tube protein TssD [Parvularculaceae bacterium]
MHKYLLIAALFAFAAAPAAASDAAYLKVQGSTTGKIEGGVTQKGHEGEIKVLAFTHEIVSPRDAASGLPTGKRQHKPFTITKPIDKSSPLLMSALDNNETLPDVRLQLFSASTSARGAVGGPGGSGIQQNTYTIELINAHIASISLDSSVPGEDREIVEFVYQSVVYTFPNGGISAQLDTSSP